MRVQPRLDAARPRRPALRVVFKAALIAGLLAAWTTHVWINPGSAAEVCLGTALTAVVSLQLLGSLTRQADAAWGPGWLSGTLDRRVAPTAVQAMATLWLVGLFTPYRAAIMVITSLATTGIVVATELVADPRWLTGRGTFAALAIAVAVAVGVLLSALVIVFVLAAGALTLVIGAGIARRAWR